MKNWLIIILIIIVPLIGYGILDTAKAKTNDQIVTTTTQMATILKFSTPMCLDCQLSDKLFSKYEPEFQSKIVFKKIDPLSKDKNVKKMLKTYQITVAPTVIFIKKDGKTFVKKEGLMTEKQLEKELKKLTHG